MLLELNDYGVQEMNQQEMAAVEGGSFWAWVGGILMVVAGFLAAPVAVPLAAAGFIISTIDGFVSEQFA
ncbi:hypothetical protein WBJ53_25735 [Spirosoma sp. SC4-14]|uniref:hypothetical protein n=1 Tax=Spirosoma sp. SC4-14 TaxID=3128900 RepID=UPI0030D0235F